MHPDEITPERFAPAVAAITTALDTLDTQAERAELLATLTRTFEVWVAENETSTPEHEVVASLASATRSYWLDSMSAGGDR
ncbi:MAG TPA: hypothetical protein PLY47_09780 [Rhodoglobus sp.]|jgi:hypothetical protein|nr:hypothetical protein [Rhodoglobus sp.]